MLTFSMAIFAKANTAIVAVMNFKGQFWLEISMTLYRDKRGADYGNDQTQW